MKKLAVRRLGLLTFILFFAGAAFSQKVNMRVTMEDIVAAANSDTIYYNPNRLLTWSDFQGAPQLGGAAGAVTSSGFAFSASASTRDNVVDLSVNIYTHFSKKNSWKKPGIGTAYHLLHEQRHFDITRLGAQKFYDELLKANFSITNYNQLLTSIFNKTFEDSRHLQQKYDAETGNSMNTTEQLQWNDKIAEELKALY